MYAPLDFRLVISPEPTLTNLQQNKAAADRHGSPPDQKTNPCSWVPIRGRGLLALVAQNGLKIVLLCFFRLDLGLNQAPIE
jgi:hypothetical protein